MTAKKGDIVKIHYTGSFDDGEVFDSSEEKDPLEFELGVGKVIKGFDDAIVGMKIDEEKNIKLQPEEAYGVSNPELVKKIPRNVLPEEQEPKPGMMLLLQAGNGQQFPAKITEVDSKEVTVDMNHPMAGKVLNFKLKLVEVETK